MVDRLPALHKNAFIFSTRGARKLAGFHRALRRQLNEKGWTIVGEFSCRGFDTYGLTKWLAGLLKEGQTNRICETLRNLRDLYRKMNGSVRRTSQLWGEA